MWENAPDISNDDVATHFLEMFYICSTQRNSGLDISHIPQLDLIKLSEYYNVYDPYFWVYTMRLLDNEYVAHVRELNKPKDTKKNGSFGKGKGNSRTR